MGCQKIYNRRNIFRKTVMKWYRRNVNTNHHKVEDKRCIVVFLWWPKNIDGEVRWFERAWIRQEVAKCRSSFSYDTLHRWRDVKWSSENDEFLERL